jgi:hypothetical protein
MTFTHSDAFEVKRIKCKGPGVFAHRLIRMGELIERLPMLLPVETSAYSSSFASPDSRLGWRVLSSKPPAISRGGGYRSRSRSKSFSAKSPAVPSPPATTERSTS